MLLDALWSLFIKTILFDFKILLAIHCLLGSQTNLYLAIVIVVENCLSWRTKDPDCLMHWCLVHSQSTAVLFCEFCFHNDDYKCLVTKESVSGLISTNNPVS